MSGPIQSFNPLASYAGGGLLRRGSRGAEVRALQTRLGIKPDGIFGPQTERSLRNYQRQHGLQVDGIFGPQSRGHIFPGAASRAGIGGSMTGAGSLLRRGSRGAEVRALQTRLGIKADGIFGPQTERSLSNYQRQHGLKVDGMFGPQSRSHLFRGAASQAGIGGSMTGGSSLLRRGSRGADVRAMQTRLGIKADGIFGPQTERSLRNYQRQHGLQVDGIFGPQSRSNLFRGAASQAGIGGSMTGASSLLRRGSRGADVRAMQTRLGIKVDGIFGPQTERAVRSYQSQHGLQADGIFGPQTRRQLFGGRTPQITTRPPVVTRRRTRAPGGPASTGIKFSVPTIAHTGGEDLCFWDSISMVAQHKKLSEMVKSPFGGVKRPWDRLVSSDTQSLITQRGQGIFHTGEHIGTVRQAVRKFGFQEEFIPVTPQEFQRALQDHGPFVYIGRERTRNLLGQPQNHSLAITGMERQGNQFYISYNNPRSKKPKREEFYGFLLKYMPFLTRPGRSNESMILHIK